MTASRDRSGELKFGWRRRRDLSWRRFGITAALFAVTLAGLFYSVYGLNVSSALEVGEPSPQTFLAPQQLTATDEVATARERQAARNQVGTIYSSVPELRQLVFDELARSALPERVERYLRAAYNRPQGVSSQTLGALLTGAVALVPEAQRPRLRQVLSERLLASAEPNARLSEAAREAAAASVTPVLRQLTAGEVIVAKGQPLTDNTLSLLESVGLYNPRGEQLEQGVRLGLTSALLALLLSLPLFYFYTTLRHNTSVGQLSFLVLLWAAALVAQRLALLADTSFLFVAFLPLLGAVLFGERLAFVLAVWLSIITAFFAPGSSFVTLLIALGGSTVAVLLTRAFRTRASLLIAGLAGSVAGLLGFAVYTALSGGFGTVSLAASLAWILGGGLLAGILALAALPLAESNLGFLTEFRLLELMSPSNPLLQKLLLEAPGTYQHSLIISNLVEQAVSAIGGDALLARVGALYHDVGKLRRPQFFTENQFAGENPHDRTSPHLSYLIITSHVRDGAELLREYGLPAALEPFVNEHHGTTVLAYFYKRALEGSDNIKELNFRYAGPRPQSKETAVLMLADAVESASRTLTEPSQGSIRAMIDRLFEQRLQDDQLAESPLNFHDLEVIANTFERLMTAILHRRVSYPSPEEIGRLKRDRDPRRSAPLPLP
jgi:putative nucleotidyltransferase with HDIG domain